MLRKLGIANLRQDLIYALRTLRKAPSFTAIVVLTLALGIGATTTIFAVIEAVMIRPIAYADPDRLVLIRESFPRMGLTRTSVSLPEFIAYRDESEVFEEVAGFENGALTLTEGGQAERLAATRVSANLFPLLRTVPMLGRTFVRRNEDPGADRVVVLSYETWRRRFGADPTVVGRTVHFEGDPYEVLGVLPRDFQFPHPGMLFSEPADLWIPLSFTPEQRIAPALSINTHVVARLKAGVTVPSAEAYVRLVLRRFLDRHPEQLPAGAVETVDVVPLRTEVLGGVRGPLLLLMGAVALVLVIACANIGHLMLVRVGNRQAELAIRTALGADRSRLIRQVLTETTVLGILGGAGGLMLSALGVRLLIGLRPGDVPRLAESHLDPLVLAFALGASLLTGFIVGVVPAGIAARAHLGEALAMGRGPRGRSRRGGVKALIVAEVALAIVLLVGTGLLVRSFIKVQQVDSGVTREGVLFARVYPGTTRYATGRQVNVFYQALLDQLGRIPGVQGAALTSTLLVRDLWNAGYAVEDEVRRGDVGLRSARDAFVSTDYFKVLGIPIRRGRAFAEQDRSGSPLVVIINETMARRHWPGADPVGKRLSWGDPRSAPWRTIVGVVADVKETGLDAATLPSMYVPYAQINHDTTSTPVRSFVVAIRSGLDPDGLITPLRSAIAAIDPDIPIDGVRTVSEIYATGTASRRFNTVLISLFGIAALGLAVIGLYGVISHSVAERVPEIGIRMAVGARRGDVIRMVVGEGLGFTGLGLLLGIAVAIPATGLLANLVFGVGRFDLLTFAAVATVLVVAAAVASYLPARRAARVDPMSTLRGG